MTKSIQKRAWTTPKLKMIEVEETLSSPRSAQAEAQNNSQQDHIPGGARLS